MKRLIERIRRPSAAVQPPRSTAIPPGSDIVSRLPVELVLLVLASLEVDDVRAGLAVCRWWRHVWLSDDIWPGLAERWAPGLVQHIRATTTTAAGSRSAGQEDEGGYRETEEKAKEKEAAGEKFRRSLVRTRRRIAGRFVWALPHGMALEADRVFRLDRAVPVVDGGVHAYGQVPELAGADAGRFPRFMFYCNGRIAWWPEAYGLPYLAVVDDLRSRRRRMYLYPGADANTDHTGYITALGDRLLLMGRGPQLHAWHLDDDRLATAPPLPAPIARTVVEGDTVLVVTKLGAVFLWAFGHDALRPVDVAGCYAPGPVLADRDAGALRPRPPVWRTSRVGLRVLVTGTTLDFALHPTAPGVFFVAALEGRRLVVHERAADGSRSASYPLVFPGGGGGGNDDDDDGGDEPASSSPLLLPSRWLEGAGPLRWEKTDAHGGYCLLPCWTEFAMVAAGEAEADPRPACACDDGVVAVCFNVYTKAFSFPCYSFAWFQPRAAACHVWNGRLHASARPGDGSPLVALRDCVERRAHDGQALVPLYTAAAATTTATTTMAPRRKKPDPAGGVLRRRRVPAFPDTAFGLPDKPRFRLLMQRSLDFVLDVELAPAAGGPEPRQVTNPGALLDPRQSLCGDDDFLVHVNGHEYTVWSFED